MGVILPLTLVVLDPVRLFGLGSKVTRKKYPTHNQNLKCQILLSDDYGLPKQKGERFFAPTARTKIQEPNLK